MSRFHQPVFIVIFCLQLVLSVTACLPGENDVLERYNQINQRTAIENTGLSLAQAASDMSAYLVAGNLVRRAPLDDIGITTLATVSDEDNPKPNAPLGIKVATCSFVPGDDLPDDHSQRKLSAVAYFTAQPKGVPSLETTAPAMIRALAQRFGGASVGLVDGKGIPQYPKVADDADCMPNLTDAIPFSPIFAAGFKYEGAIGTLIPDSKKTTWPSVYRDITIPCPSPYQGVVKRQQHCRLITDENSKTPEEGVIDLASKKFGGKSENTLKRIEKTWECDPQDGQQLAPTTAEIDDYCRDPNAGLSQQAENTIQLGADNIKELLDTGASGYYTFKCRRNANGTNSCDAKPFNPNTNIPSTTFMRCDPQPVPEQYVINPIVPMQVDANGKVISETPTATKTGAILGNRSCGQGWTGDLIAGYQVRACRLIKVVNGVQTPMNLAQTVYKIGYVGARCTAPPREGRYDCPHPYDGKVILRESYSMTKPLALQTGTAPAGEWSPSSIPYLGNASAETRARAAQEDYIISHVPLQGLINPRFSSELGRAMAGYLQKDITGCKLAEQTCEFPPDPIKLGIVFDRSGSMKPPAANAPPPLTSATNRMICEADLGDIFTDRTTACGLLQDNADGQYPSDGRMIESVLGNYLIDSHSKKLNDKMINAINNKQTCNESLTEQMGYCMPDKGAQQSSCFPGTCTQPQEEVSGSYLAVAEEQLQVALAYVPTGSNLTYTEFVKSDNSIAPPIDHAFCNYVTDPDNCDFPSEMAAIREKILANRGTAEAGTPLIEAIDKTLKVMLKDEDYGTKGSTEPGILLLFSDGAEEDSIDKKDGYVFKNSYPYPYGSLCEQKSPPPYGKIDGRYDEFCRYAGVLDGGYQSKTGAVVSWLKGYYTQYKCGDPDGETTQACVNINTLYDAGAEAVKDSGWDLCHKYGNVTRPTFVDFVKDKLPNMKVFILNLGGRDLASCPRDPTSNIRMIDVERPNGYRSAFEDAFDALNTKSANPQDVCQRVRQTYSNAADY